MSMSCVYCDGKAICVDSRHDTSDRSTRRRYLCKMCGKRWSTIETYIRVQVDAPAPASPPPRRGLLKRRAGPSVLPPPTFQQK